MPGKSTTTDTAGDHTYTGADGSEDTYRFLSDHGNDTITGFVDGEDLIDLRRFASISDFSDLTITSDANGVTIDLTEHGGGTIRLEGFDVANLNAADFLFRVNPTASSTPEDARIIGDAGNDTLYGGDDADWIEGGAGDDTLKGDAGDDTIDGGAGDDWIAGDAGDDTIDGGAGDDWLYGREGNDTIDGGAGDDLLYGNADDDTIYGGAGDDRINGGAGDDTLIGEAGDDRFVYAAGNDTIKDFTDGDDLIDLRAISALTDFDSLSITADGTTAVIDLTGYGVGTLRLENVEVADLDADDFQFAPATAVEPPVDGI